MTGDDHSYCNKIFTFVISARSEDDVIPFEAATWLQQARLDGGDLTTRFSASVVSSILSSSLSSLTSMSSSLTSVSSSLTSVLSSLTSVLSSLTSVSSSSSSLTSMTSS